MRSEIQWISIKEKGVCLYCFRWRLTNCGLSQAGLNPALVETVIKIFLTTCEFVRWAINSAPSFFCAILWNKNSSNNYCNLSHVDSLSFLRLQVCLALCSAASFVVYNNVSHPKQPFVILGCLCSFQGVQRHGNTCDVLHNAPPLQN